MVSQLAYTQFSPRLGQNQSSTLCAATMIKSKSNEVIICLFSKMCAYIVWIVTVA